MNRPLGRLTAALASLLLLTGFTEQNLLEELDGQWQAVHGGKNYRSDAAFQLIATSKWIRAMHGTDLYSGTIDDFSITGESAVIKFGGKFSLLVYPGDSEDTLQAVIDDNLPLVFRRVAE